MNQFKHTSHKSDSHLELVNSFNKNYTSYLEASLVESVLEEILLSNEPAESSKANMLEEKIREKYLKACLLSSMCEGSNEALPADIKAPALTAEAKSHLINKVQTLLNERLAKLDAFLLDESDSQVLEKFEQLVNKKQCLEVNVEKLSDDIKLKYEHCSNAAYEIAKLLKRMLDEYRSGFYAGENKERCEHKILECQVLLSKMKSTSAELYIDLYTEDKLKSLKLIHDQIEMKTRLEKEKLDKAVSSAAAYRALGPDFDNLLCVYNELLEILERKKYAVNKLKKDNII